MDRLSLLVALAAIAGCAPSEYAGAPDGNAGGTLADSGSTGDAPNVTVDGAPAGSADAAGATPDAATPIDADLGADSSTTSSVDAAVNNPADAAVLVIADASQGCVSLPAAGSLEILGQLTPASPVFNRPINCFGLSQTSTSTHYNAVEFCAPSTSGSYSLLVEVTGDDGALTLEDSFIATYVNGFDDQLPLQNCSDANDDRANGCPPFSEPGCGSQVLGTTGSPTVQPTAVITTFGNGQTGTYRLVVTRE